MVYSKHHHQHTCIQPKFNIIYSLLQNALYLLMQVN